MAYQKKPAAWAVAGIIFALATAARAAMTPVLGGSVPYLTYYPAVMFASWYGGLGPGLLATSLCALAAQLFLVPPVRSFRIGSAADFLSLVVFIGAGILISWLNDSRQRSIELAEERLHQFETEAVARQQAEAREEEARTWASNTLASIGDAVICVDPNGRVSYMNACAETLTGWPSSDAEGRDLSDVFVIVSEETRNPVPHPVHQVLQEGRTIGLANQTLLMARNGAEIPIDDSAAPIRDRHQRILGAVLVFRDISERKALEERQRLTAERLARSNADLAEYAHAISHDLQEPLRAISAFAELLRRKYEGRLDPEAEGHIGFIVNATQRMSRMIRELLTFSRTINSQAGMRAVRMAEAVNWAEQNLEELIRETDATVECGDLPTVVADHVQLVQLFQNLIANALKYRSAKRPKVVITAHDDGACWHVAVRDNGVGIPPASHERIFQLFKRGDTDVPGAGVGLAVCKRIVERHGGEIRVESAAGEGSTFHFTLAKEHAAEFVRPPRPERQRMSGESAGG